MRRQWLRIVFFHWGLLLPALVHSQVMTLLQGTAKPDSADDNTYYWDEIKEQVWWYDSGKCVLRAENCTNAKICHRTLLLTIGNRHIEAYNEAGYRNWDHAEKLTCYEGLLVVETSVSIVCLDTAAMPIAVLMLDSCGGGKLELVGKEFGYCVPQVESATIEFFLDCGMLKTWGFLTTKGVWQVEPKFDRSFTFKDGFADVIYYGQKRKINEKGEFLE